MDYKDIIISELGILRKKEQQEGNTFKAIAYSKILQQLKSKPMIRSIEDLKDVKGIGERIQKKLEEIFETGQLEAAEEARKDIRIEMIDTFMNIYGIGRVKAIELVRENKITSIEALREAIKIQPNLLNTNQTIGLTYYEDLLERIPRTEMKKHEKIIKNIITKVSKSLEIELVGSYRRGEPTSGDIDVLIKWPMTQSMAEGKSTLKKIVEELEFHPYVIEKLALGEKKFMGICQLPGEKTRRLDILLTPEPEYGFAVMYFTGSDKFNIEVRRIALEKGYSMNEHGFTPKEGIDVTPLLLNETEIFNFLGYRYIQPKYRKAGIQFKRFLVKNS
uniref:DNA-directed DNA polymerase n=1 Tax=viral metagenome TaxID=1070528 RepID=A0A6C0CR25_9ZZZZ